MNNTITNDILESIQKNLPSVTAGELKKFIETAQADKVLLEKANNTLETALKTIENYKRVENEYATAQAKLSIATQKEAENEKVERELRVEKLKIELAAEKTVSSSFKEFLTLLVKNPRAIEIISETKNVPVWESWQGGGGHHTTRSESTMGNRERTEEK